MLRRTLLKLVAALYVVRPVRALEWVLQTAPFGQREIDTLVAVADIVLPSSLNAAAKRRVVDRFVAWHANYRQSADMGHGYGASTLRQPSGPPPAARYPSQFAAIDAAAKERGGAALGALAPAARREVIEKFLNEPQPVNRMPAQPSGANVVADLMGSYFNSPNAWDLSYQAQIFRDSCRTLDNSEAEPRRSLK